MHIYTYMYRQSDISQSNIQQFGGRYELQSASLAKLTVGKCVFGKLIAGKCLACESMLKDERKNIIYSESRGLENALPAKVYLSTSCIRNTR